MQDADTIYSALYTRQQVARLTGLDDSTLNYWMREGVLRPSEGGSGKGQHRRFPYHQVHLAILLNQLKTFGVSLPEMKRLAIKFHDALDTFERLGVTRENDEPLSTILGLRRQIEKNGFVKEQVKDSIVPKYLELFPWFEGRKLSREYSHLSWNFEANFDEALDIIRRVHLAHGREPEVTERFPDSLVDLAVSIDLAAYSKAYRYWSPLTWVDPTYREDYSYYSPNYLFRDQDGEWEIAGGDPDPSLPSYVAIKLDMLTSKAWREA